MIALTLSEVSLDAKTTGSWSNFALVMMDDASWDSHSRVIANRSRILPHSQVQRRDNPCSLGI